ncbi:hypothetical protein OC844_007838 [Tilletia horrida]|nr:hypothetical protein OC844_007838 [Tilletia horrida]
MFRPASSSIHTNKKARTGCPSSSSSQRQPSTSAAPPKQRTISKGAARVPQWEAQLHLSHRTLKAKALDIRTVRPLSFKPVAHLLPPTTQLPAQTKTQTQTAAPRSENLRLGQAMEKYNALVLELQRVVEGKMAEIAAAHAQIMTSYDRLTTNTTTAATTPATGHREQRVTRIVPSHTGKTANDVSVHKTSTHALALRRAGRLPDKDVQAALPTKDASAATVDTQNAKDGKKSKVDVRSSAYTVRHRAVETANGVPESKSAKGNSDDNAVAVVNTDEATSITHAAILQHAPLQQSTEPKSATAVDMGVELKLKPKPKRQCSAESLLTMSSGQTALNDEPVLSTPTSTLTDQSDEANKEKENDKDSSWPIDSDIPALRPTAELIDTSFDDSASQHAAAFSPASAPAPARLVVFRDEDEDETEEPANQPARPPIRRPATTLAPRPTRLSHTVLNPVQDDKENAATASARIYALVAHVNPAEQMPVPPPCCFAPTPAALALALGAGLSAGGGQQRSALRDVSAAAAHSRLRRVSTKTNLANLGIRVVDVDAGVHNGAGAEVEQEEHARVEQWLAGTSAPIFHAAAVAVPSSSAAPSGTQPAAVPKPQSAARPVRFFRF